MKNSAIFVISAILVGALAVAAYTMSNDTTTELDGVQQSAAEALNATEPAAGALDSMETESSFEATTISSDVEAAAEDAMEATEEAAEDAVEATEEATDAAVEETEEAMDAAEDHADEAHDEVAH